MQMMKDEFPSNQGHLLGGQNLVLDLRTAQLVVQLVLERLALVAAAAAVHVRVDDVLGAGEVLAEVHLEVLIDVLRAGAAVDLIRIKLGFCLTSTVFF